MSAALARTDPIGEMSGRNVRASGLIDTVGDDPIMQGAIQATSEASEKSLPSRIFQFSHRGNYADSGRVWRVLSRVPARRKICGKDGEVQIMRLSISGQHAG